MTDTSLKIINDKLCLISSFDGKIILSFSPFTKIAEFKSIEQNCIIVREDTKNFDTSRSNIYRLDDNFEVIWFSELPVDYDTYPNQIAWEKELNGNGTSWDDYVVSNNKTLSCSSQKGFTVTIDYEKGKIIKSEFTR